MAAIRLKQTLFSLRTTAFLLCIFILFLILNVVIPQERVVGRAAMQEALASGLVQRFLLKDLGLSHLPTSVPFLVVLGALYLQLVVLLWKLGGSTLRRVRIAPAHWDTWKNVNVRSSSQDAVKTAVDEGFRLKHLNETTWWGVRNRYSPVGFLLLHGSFLLLLTGGLFIYYTRFVARVSLVAGDAQVFSAQGPGGLIRTPPFMPSASQEPITIQMLHAEAIRESGEPITLKANLRFFSRGGSTEEAASVNHPAVFMGYRFMPDSSDLAMTFRLYDRQGYLQDTVVALTRCQAGGRTTVPLAGSCSLEIECADSAGGLLVCDGQLGAMALQVNESITTDSYYLTLVSITPWVSFLVVRERGGNFLIAGFVLAVIGLVMRFLFPRQDLIITTGQIYYKGEFFPLYLGDYLKRMEEKNIVTN